MPRTAPRNKDRLNQESPKQNIEVEKNMTEEDKENIASCRGIKQEHPCKNPVFVCQECGNYGCAQAVAEVCTEQGFKNNKCLHCGVVDKNVPVKEEEYEKVRAQWYNEVPETK